MSDRRKKFITTFMPIIGVLTLALVIMIRSFSTGETWRIIFSITGFIGFFVLTSLFAKTMINKEMKNEKNN